MHLDVTSRSKWVGEPDYVGQPEWLGDSHFFSLIVRLTMFCLKVWATCIKGVIDCGRRSSSWLSATHYSGNCQEAVLFRWRNLTTMSFSLFVTKMCMCRAQQILILALEGAKISSHSDSWYISINVVCEAILVFWGSLEVKQPQMFLLVPCCTTHQRSQKQRDKEDNNWWKQ